jgi:hypothetical protein
MEFREFNQRLNIIVLLLCTLLLPGEFMSCALNGTGKFVLMLPLIVKVVLWSLVVEEPLVVGSVVEVEE